MDVWSPLLLDCASNASIAPVCSVYIERQFGIMWQMLGFVDNDYCSTCHGKLLPPLMHPEAITGHHTVAHRFLRVEKDVPTEHMNVVMGTLRATPLADTPGKLVELDPCIVHCLSEPDDVVQGVVQALVAYRTHCLQVNLDEKASGIADLEALDAALGTLVATLPLVAEFAKSRSHLLLRIRDGISTIQYVLEVIQKYFSLNDSTVLASTVTGATSARTMARYTGIEYTGIDTSALTVPVRRTALMISIP